MKRSSHDETDTVAVLGLSSATEDLHKRRRRTTLLMYAAIPILSVGVIVSSVLVYYVYINVIVTEELEQEPIKMQASGHAFSSNIVAGVGPAMYLQKEPFTFEDIFNPDYLPNSPRATWLPASNKVYHVTAATDLVVSDVNTGKDVTVIPGTQLGQLEFGDIFFSYDESFVLIAYDQVTAVQTAHLWASFKIYNVEKQEFLDFPNDGSMAGKMLLYAGWVGNTNGLTFVFEDDLYFQDSPTGSVERLTTSGSTHKIRNGLSFWNYNGVLWRFPNHWWSPDLRHLVYGEFNSTEVPVSPHEIYGKTEDTYGDIFSQVYLKSGDTASFSNGYLYAMDMEDEGRPQVAILPPEQLRNQDHYFYEVTWRDNDHLVVAWCNRKQTYSIITVCAIQDGVCHAVYERTLDNGWLREPPLKTIIENGERALFILPNDVAGHGSFQQVALMTLPLKGMGEVTYLTSDAKEVFSIKGFDHEKNTVFYEATNGDQLEKHIFSVTLSADGQSETPVCLTCDDDACADSKYFRGSFSASTEHVIVTCMGPGLPKTYMRWTRQGKVDTIEANADLAERLASKAMPSREYQYIDLADGYKGYVELVIPPNMKRDGSTKHPLLLYPYAGPHGHTQADYSYKTNTAKSGGWENYLASSEAVVVARINGRGTGARGDDFLFTLHKKLGTYEIQDQIAGARSLLKKFSFLDSERVAIWGWSYGGFTTSHVIGDSSDVIKCGLAVAPVTNFRWYYSGYTERYMDLDTPEDNEAGYNATDVTRKAANFKGKKFFLAHGTLDDNVHFQNSAQLIKALIEEGIDFQQQVYVDQNHSIGSPHQMRHLFTAMTQFLKKKCFGL